MSYWVVGALAVATKSSGSGVGLIAGLFVAVVAFFILFIVKKLIQERFARGP